MFTATGTCSAPARRYKDSANNPRLTFGRELRRADGATGDKS
jgi:hypothetical protein